MPQRRDGILSANIEGLCSAKDKPKLKFLQEKAIDENIGIIALTESHLIYIKILILHKDIFLITQRTVYDNLKL